MKKVFIKTKNVKKFYSLMEEIQNLPMNIPKFTLVYGEPGLGKSETVMKWAFQNKCVYVRANNGMTSRWLLSAIAEELNIDPHWHIDNTFNDIRATLMVKRKVIIIDEIDYLIEKKALETLRDLLDATGCPMVLVGMQNAERQLKRFPHFYDRIYKIFKFENYDRNDIKTIIKELLDIPITDDGAEYLITRAGQFRQIGRLVNQVEKLAKTNQVTELNEYILGELLNERPNLKTLQKVG